MNEILTLKNVSLIYHTPKTEIVAVKDVSFSLAAGEFVSIIGPSGCGKTSILSIVAGLVPPSGGEIVLRGKKVKKPSVSVGYMFQRDELFPWRTIEKNAMLPLEITRRTDEKSRKRVLMLLKKYGLGDFAGRYPAELSGGMRQRAALIRTLASDPEILLLDEPFPHWTTRREFPLQTTYIPSSNRNERLRSSSPTTYRRPSPYPTGFSSSLPDRPPSHTNISWIPTRQFHL